MKNAVNWFEIPAKNIDRAVGFYNQVLNLSLRREVFLGVPHGIFPADEAGAGGAVIQRENDLPSLAGTLIYLDAGGDLDGALARTVPAGGKVVVPKTHIGGPGYIAVIVDSEGNRIGLHTPN